MLFYFLFLFKWICWRCSFIINNSFGFLTAKKNEPKNKPGRGRPKKGAQEANKQPPKIIYKIMEAVNNNPGQPILYASTTKGTMKLVVDGHHFRYSFRKGKYTIFQCCYKENREECNVRVVTDQKLVYPLDGEHVHFIQATDKSVTSLKFSPGTDIDLEVANEPEPTVVDEAEQQISSEAQEVLDEVTPTTVENVVTQPKEINVKLEKGVSQEQMEFTNDVPATAAAEDPNEFREKIKKRLQKALLGKKK